MDGARGEQHSSKPGTGIMRELDQIHYLVRELTAKVDGLVSRQSLFDPDKYVTQEQFKPMAKLFWFIVFSFAGIIVSAIGTLIIQSNVHLLK